MRAMTTFRTFLPVGFAFAVAAACGGDDGGDDDDTTSSGTVGATGMLVDGTTSNTTGGPSTVNATSATGNATSTTGSGTGGSAGEGMGGSAGEGTGGTGGDAGTGGDGTGGTGGSGGSAGAGGEEPCDPDPGVSAGGAAGAAGAGNGMDEGYHFTDPVELDDWAIKPTANCGSNCFDGSTLEAGCGSMLMSVPWPEAANSAIQKVLAENNAPGDERWDLTGRTVTVRVRWVSGGDTGQNGFDIYFEVNDNEWNGNSQALGDTFDITEGFSEFTVTMPDGPDGDFDPATVRQLNIRFDSKYWTDTGNPPVFDYEPSVFEIDAIVW